MNKFERSLSQLVVHTHTVLELTIETAAQITIMSSALTLSIVFVTLQMDRL